MIVADDSTDSEQKDGAALLAKVKEAKGKPLHGVTNWHFP